ncbi:MFS transporter [Streptomyces niveiscabiei]|nr:MFS transporter [Streptomyces niveiscabiei]
MSYRDLATRPALTWSAVSVGARMPVAMAPLALVFLARERPGGYTLGAVLAAAFVLGEIVGAPVLGMRLRTERARAQLAAGLAGGALGFAGLGVLPGAHPAVLVAFAFLAGGAPAASAGGLRTLLTELVPERAAAQALSAESMLMSGVWALSPAAVAGLALGVAPKAPLLLGAALMAASVAGLWLLPAAWGVGGAERAEGSRARVLAGAWPVYVTGAASLTMLGLAELTLPALLEQRGIGVGWSGPLLAAMAVAAGLGAFVYGLRNWPGLLRTRGLVLTTAMAACVTLVALATHPLAVGAALCAGGMFQAGATVTRNLALRDALPPGALAAGYSVMYAAAGAGYAATGSLAGLLLKVMEPSSAVLAGVVLILLLSVVGWAGEAHRAGRSAHGGAVVAGAGGDAGSAAGVPVPPERTAIGRRRDAQGGL